jgi:hypothetical protein
MKGEATMRIRKEELELQLPIMIAYLRLKLDQQDWHGVADAAMDIREIVARLEIFQQFTKEGT